MISRAKSANTLVAGLLARDTAKGKTATRLNDLPVEVANYGLHPAVAVAASNTDLIASDAPRARTNQPTSPPPFLTPFALRRRKFNSSIARPIARGSVRGYSTPLFNELITRLDSDRPVLLLDPRFVLCPSRSALIELLSTCF